MSWQFFILVQAVLSAFSVIAIRILARERQTAKASFVINAGWYVVLYATGLVFLPWLGHVHLSVVHDYGWRFIGGGLAFALANVCTYKTLVYFDAAIASIVGTVNTLFTVVGSSLVLAEYLTALQVIGGVVLFWAITYAVLTTRRRSAHASKRNVDLGIIYALLAGFYYAVAIVNEKSLLGHMSLSSYVVFGWGGQMVMSVLAAVLVQPQAFKLLLRPRVMGWAAVSGAIKGVAGVCFMLSEVKSNNVGLVTAISNFRLIVVILLGAWWLKERRHIPQKLVAAAVAIIGLSMMLWK